MQEIEEGNVQFLKIIELLSSSNYVYDIFNLFNFVKSDG